MLKKYLLLLSLFFIAAVATAAPKEQAKNNNDNKVIFSIDNEKFTYKDVKRAFEKTSMNKNANFESISRDSIMNFLDLYINYRLKVTDGLNQGLNKDTNLLKEIDENQRLLCESFIFDKEIVEPAINYYEQLRKTDKQIALIMTTFDITGDTTNAYKQITSALKELKNSAKFDFVARKYSADTST